MWDTNMVSVAFFRHIKLAAMIFLTWIGIIIKLQPLKQPILLMTGKKKKKHKTITRDKSNHLFQF